jgi:hypothetical protein
MSSTILYKTQTTNVLNFDATACAQKVTSLFQSNNSNGSHNTNIPFLVTWAGTLTTNISEAVGIAYPFCKEYCGTGRAVFNWVTFTTSVSAWVFPWLALIAQLPFEAKNTWENIMSFFLCVGSPQLIAFSLAIHVLVSRHIHENIQQLIRRATTELCDQASRDALISTLQHVCKFLVGSITSPLQLGSADVLRQLIINPKPWWEIVTKEMAKTSREW